MSSLPETRSPASSTGPRRPRATHLFGLATLTLGSSPEHLEDVITGYGTDVDRDLIRACWVLRCVSKIRWLCEHGYRSHAEFPEVAVLHAQA